MTPRPLAVFILCAAIVLFPGPAAAQYAGGPLMSASIPYVGADLPYEDGYDGSGVTIAIIDTGVDFAHPDLARAGKNSSEDLDGHGTEVAGIIAADGALRGIVPGAAILSYKISDDGVGVSAQKIIKAIEKAVADGADIINISLGINRTNPDIDEAVTRAAAAGVLVVSAAGNDGPGASSIGSPGINPNAFTIGATHNNVSSSIVASLEVDGEYFSAVPMVGTASADGTIEAQVVFGAYARESDLQNGRYGGTIILAERGSDIPDEMVFFTEKEKNAADSGAVAVIIYNNAEGIFIGDLNHNGTDAEYEPSIFAASVSREDGLRIIELIKNGAPGRLETLLGIDTVAHFSSRGPVSPFYIKPDMVAPGAYVNTTSKDGGYEIASGTSFATPHVAGAAAALLNKNPNLSAGEIRSILSSTADSSGSAGPDSEGSGRLNVTRAFAAGIILHPPHLAVHLSPERPSATGVVLSKAVDGRPVNVSVRAVMPGDIKAQTIVDGGRILLTISTDLLQPAVHYGRLLIYDGTVNYTVPVMATVTDGTIRAEIKNGTLYTEIIHPSDWSYARITVENPSAGWSQTVTAKPDSPATLQIHEKGTYWISAAIDSFGQPYEAYATAKAGTPQVLPETVSLSGVPVDAMIIAAAAFGAMYTVHRAFRP